MFSSQTTKEIVKQKIINDLAVNAGIDNSSKSSIGYQITDAISGPIADNIQNVNMAINSVYTDLAEGSFLTANAYDFGVIRNIYSDVYIKDTDNVVIVRMENNSSFPDYFEGAIIIYAGQKIIMNDSITVEFLKDLYLTPGETYGYASVKISSNFSADLTKGSAISLSDLKSSLTSGLVLELVESVNFNLVEESDTSLRRRTNSAKLRLHGSSQYTIAQWVENTPGVYDYKLEYIAGLNVYNIYVITKRYLSNFEDRSIDSIISSVRYRLDSYCGAEIKYNISAPEIYKVSFAYKYSSITDSVADNIIGKAFEESYKYSGNNSLSVYELNEYIKEITEELEIDGILLYSDIYGNISQDDATTITLPSSVVLAYDKSLNLRIEEE